MTRAVWWGAAAIAAAIALSACIGATDRADFDVEVRARGGGLTAAFVTGSLDDIAEAAGAGDWRDLAVLSINIDPGSRAVTAAVRSPQQPDFVDTITVRDGRVVAQTPVRDADEMALEQLVVYAGTLPLEDIEEIAATALAEFAEPDGYVDVVYVRRATDGVRIDVSLESARRTATATFDEDGTFVGLDR